MEPPSPRWGRWDCLKKRLQECSRSRLSHNSDGAAVVRINILFDAQGNPIGWTEPQVYRLEPSNLNWKELLMAE